MKLSIVTSLYQASKELREFHRRMSASAAAVTTDYELILVNDGSTDGTLEIARSLCDRDEHLTVVDLTRNFGSRRAIMTGLMRSTGERVFTLDSDLEEEPELLADFWADMDETAADAVYGVQESRKGNLFERASGRVFYLLLRALSDVPIPPNLTGVRLMSRRYVDSLLEHRERETIMAGLFALTGYQQIPRVIRKHSTSPTTHTLLGKTREAANGLTALSHKPLFLVAAAGLSVLAVGVIAAFALAIGWALSDTSPSAIAWLGVSVWLVGGLGMCGLGVVAIYLSIVVKEVKQRPFTQVREIYGARVRDASEWEHS